MEIDFNKLPEENSIYYDYAIPGSIYEECKKKLKENKIETVKQLKQAYIEVINQKSNYSKQVRKFIEKKFEEWYSLYIDKVYNVKQTNILTFQQYRQSGKLNHYINELIDYLEVNQNHKIRIAGVYTETFIIYSDDYVKLSREEKYQYILEKFKSIKNLENNSNLERRYL